VVLLKDGRIVADGPKPEILVQDKIESLFGVPVSLSERNGYTHAW